MLEGFARGLELPAPGGFLGVGFMGVIEIVYLDVLGASVHTYTFKKTQSCRKVLRSRQPASAKA